MRYWWVNQKQTYRHERDGGFIWSPKRKGNGTLNTFYENMRRVLPGDRLFSYAGGEVVALSTITSICYDSPKPEEFGFSGINWDQSGWMVDVNYQELRVKVRPMRYIDRIRPDLPVKYAPLQRDTGYGLQGVYLTELPDELAETLLTIIAEVGNEVPPAEAARTGDQSGRERIAPLEDMIETAINVTGLLTTTEKEQLILARRGQGRFRQNVLSVETSCRVTGISNPNYLVASHIKPWRISDNAERLDCFNGFMLAPSIDFLFDRGLISFSDDGLLLISGAADRFSLARLGIDASNTANVGEFCREQLDYLSFHRANIYLQAGAK